MNYTGNDIISLRSDVNIKSFSNPKFITKVLNKSELSIACKTNLSLTAPLCWAVKESCYKVLMKAGLEKSFSPHFFNIHLLKTDPKNTIMKNKYQPGFIRDITVTAYGTTLYSMAELSGDVIHAISVLKYENLPKIRYGIRKTEEHDDYSEDAGQMLIRAIASESGKKNRDLQLLKNDRNIPYLTEKGLPLNIDVSLSHDGNFISYAYLIIN